MQENTEYPGGPGWLDPKELGVPAQGVATQEGDIAEETWSRAPLHQLVQRLLRDHRRWLHVDLPTIDHLLDHVSDDCGPELPASLPRLRALFRRLRFDLERHTSNEENLLFPAIVELERGVVNGLPLPRPVFGSIRNPITMMQRDLESDQHLLGEVRAAVRECAAPEGARATLDAFCAALAAIETTLKAHMDLENTFLFPRAIRLEQVAWPLS